MHVRLIQSHIQNGDICVIKSLPEVGRVRGEDCHEVAPDLIRSMMNLHLVFLGPQKDRDLPSTRSSSFLERLILANRAPQLFAIVGLWVSESNNEAMALVALWSNTQQFDDYAICDSKEIGAHGECYLYGHCTSNWLFIRIVFIQSHRIVLFTHSLLYIATPGHAAKIWEFSSAGGLIWTCVQGGS